MVWKQRSVPNFGDLFGIICPQGYWENIPLFFIVADAASQFLWTETQNP